MGRTNGLKVTRSMLSLNSRINETKVKASHGTLDLFRTPIMRMRMMILMITWFTCCLTYYGLTFGASGLGGNMYINLALSGLVEVPASLLSVCSLNRLGRRPTMAGSLFIASVSCLGVVAFPKSLDGAMSSAQTCLALIGKMGISVSFNTLYLFSSELLPTVLRNTGMGVCSMSARVGGILAPMLPPFGDRVAYLTFGIVALLSSILDLSLPESLNKPLPETVADVEIQKHQASSEKEEKLLSET
ncbi:solute carrier family 22 member 15-like [Asterias amurensis]|uniref:solute carrier family 22 member 15-like n=1 Tax=Asterias amurensis TaxID=7602 RepID=UPI003AB7FB62